MSDLPAAWTGYFAGQQNVRANEHQNLQSAIGTMGILQHLQAAKEQQDLQKAISGGDLQTLLRTKGGLAVLKQMNDMQNSGVTAGLHSAQTAEINRKATTADTQQKAVTDLSNLFNPQSPFWTQNGGVAPNEVRAPIPDEHAQDQAAALKLSQMGDTPYSIGVPPQGKVQSLAIQAGNALPRGMANTLINPAGLSPNANGVGAVARAVPGGYIEKQPDGTVKFNPTATQRGAATTPDSTPTTAPTLSTSEKATLDLQSWNYLTRRVLPYRKGTGGGADRNDAVLKNAGEIASTLGMTPEELSTMPETKQADARSLYAQTKKVDMIQGTMNSFHYNLDTWESLAQGLKPTIGGKGIENLSKDLQKINFVGIRTIDELKLKIQKEFNDPTVSAYVIASMAAAMDYGRIMAGGSQSAAMTPEGARVEAMKIMSSGADENGRKGIRAALESDAQGQVQGQVDQMNVTRDRLTGKARGKQPVPTADVTKGKTPEFATEADALKAGVTGDVIIGGRKAKIQ